MKPKISIIVPVYKVEQYIHQCIDSILQQTFTDFELILINDGSPDNCGVICDDYAIKDQRVKVIHKENGGQSSARNAGLDIARGDYIGFVDSDDWIESGMYKLLYEMCITNNCEIANCSSIIHYENKTVKNGGHPLTVHNRDQAMRIMLEGILYDEVVWTKLIKRDLLEGIRFKAGIIYEDTAFTYKVIHKSHRVCCIGTPMYHYIKRENSTMDMAIKNIKIDAVLVYDEMFEFVALHYKELKDLVVLKLANSAMSVLNLITFSQSPEHYKKDFKKVVFILNKHFPRTLMIKELPNTVKILLAATKIYPSSYKFIVNFSTKGALK